MPEGLPRQSDNLTLRLPIAESLAIIIIGMFRFVAERRAAFDLGRIVLSQTKESNLQRGRSVFAHTFSFLQQAASAKFPLVTISMCP